MPPNLAEEWHLWRTGLPELTEQPIPRRVFSSNQSRVILQLHGFSNASLLGYGCVVYLRTVYQDISVEVSLVTSKTKVVPLSPSTIPRLELCGAHLLAKLLSTVAKDLGLSRESVYAWCDSSIVLGWLNTNHT